MSDDTSPPAGRRIDRLYALDVLRGVAALSVVLWHWQNFVGVGTESPDYLSVLPLSRALAPFYLKGYLGVDFFFCLSGFVFHWLYWRPVSAGSMSFGQFALLRFSRLYPLHFVALLAVAVGQFWVMRQQGHYFVVPHNDAKHFLLNLFFASSWGLEDGFSFNAPVWSVSWEVLLYGIFFAYSRFMPVQTVPFVALGLLIHFISSGTFQTVACRSIDATTLSFFLGACVFLLYEWILELRETAVIARGLCVVAGISWALALFVQGRDGHLAGEQWFPLVPTVWLFPVTILALALAETCWGSIGKRLSLLGDVSYASYMLHFPLQLLCYIIFSELETGSAIYSSALFLIAFYLVLLCASVTSYNFLERPMQKWIRHWGR